MSNAAHDESPHTPSKAGSFGVAVASLAEGLARDAAVTGAVLFSLVAAVGGVLSGEVTWIVVGLGVGLTGMVLPFVALGRKWDIGRTWSVLVGTLVADVAVMFGMWTGG